MNELRYETGFNEKRLTDGTRRWVIVTDRRRKYTTLGTMVSVGLAVIFFSAVLIGHGPPRIILVCFIVAPAIAGCLIALCLRARYRTDVIEVKAKGLRIQSSIMGDQVDRFHSREDIVYVARNTIGMEVATVQDLYTCLEFADRAKLAYILKELRDELKLELTFPPGSARARAAARDAARAQRQSRT